MNKHVVISPPHLFFDNTSASVDREVHPCHIKQETTLRQKRQLWALTLANTIVIPQMCQFVILAVCSSLRHHAWLPLFIHIPFMGQQILLFFYSLHSTYRH